MPLTGRQRKDILSSYSRRRRIRRIGVGGLISLLIHILVGVLLLVTIQREERSELLPPPAPVTMVFEGGRKQGPTLPEPSLQAVPATPPAPATPPPQKPTTEPPLPSPPIPPAPLPPQAPPPSAAPPPEISKVAPSPSPLPTPFPPSAPPPAAQAPLPQAPASPPAVTEAPVLRPPTEAGPLPLPPRERKQPDARVPPRPAAPPGQSDFPAPMNFSFGPPRAASPAQTRPRPSPHPPGTFDMSLGPASRGPVNTTPFGDREDAEGADWRNELSRWVAQHAYYPEQARRELQEGDAKVRVVAAPDGRVKLVELIGRSGSMWLDLALLALFRDANIPPLPSGERDPIEFNFTMHYILIRPR